MQEIIFCMLTNRTEFVQLNQNKQLPVFNTTSVKHLSHFLPNSSSANVPEAAILRMLDNLKENIKNDFMKCL
jgi:hypothetical protein